MHVVNRTLAAAVAAAAILASPAVAHAAPGFPRPSRVVTQMVRTNVADGCEVLTRTREVVYVLSPWPRWIRTPWSEWHGTLVSPVPCWGRPPISDPGPRLPLPA